MSFANAIKEIYESQKGALSESVDYCEIAPEFDADHWESKLNSVAEYEEPAAVLCYGEAGAKGLLSIFSKSGFMFTEEYVYIEGIKKGMKYADISKISYREETKSGFFGKKVEGFLVIEKSGKKEEIKGNVATKPIATFLNAVVHRYKTNPVAPVPQKEYPNVSKIVEALEENQSESVTYQIAPNISQRALNKFIIHSAKDETKASIAGLITGKRMPTLILSNDSLYCKFSESEDLKKVNYSELAKATFSKTKTTSDDGIVKIEEKVTLFDKNNQQIFKGTSPIEVANLLNKVISFVTGQEIQTEIKSNIPVSTPEIVQQRKKIADVIEKVGGKYWHPSIDGFTDPNTIKEIREITTKYDASEVIFYTSEALFLTNGFYIKGVSQEGFFEYTQLSKIAFYESKENTSRGKLIFFDKNDDECFNQEQYSFRWGYLEREVKEGFSFDIVEVICAISKEVFSNDIKLEKTEELCHKVIGAAASDNEEEKNTWNDLLSKWDEIFSRDDEFKCKEVEFGAGYAEVLDFKHYYGEIAMIEKTFASEDKAIWLYMSEDCSSEDLNSAQNIQIIYTPNMNSSVVKLLSFCVFRESHERKTTKGVDISYSVHLKLSFISGEHSATVETNTFKGDYQLSLRQLLTSLGKEDVYNHFSSFVKKLEQEVINHSEETKRQATDDLSNW